MSIKKIFIDGDSGTTGLEIIEKLENRHYPNVELMKIPFKDRKNPDRKLSYYFQADLVVLCLPDESARESVRLIQKNRFSTKILDTSTAHRTSSGWVYGFPELRNRKNLIAKAQKVANPGCYATGIIAILRPLMEEGLLDLEVPLSCFAVSGYSGGGRKMIAHYDHQIIKGKRENKEMYCFNPYALDLDHKHLPEIRKETGIKNLIFQPAVVEMYRGMLIHLPVRREWFRKKKLSVKNAISSDKKIKLEKNDTHSRDVTFRALQRIYKNYYRGEEKIRFMEMNDDLIDDKFIDPTKNNNTNQLDILCCYGKKSKVFNLFSRLDNLGKGASGTALQNIELMLGL